MENNIQNLEEMHTEVLLEFRGRSGCFRREEDEREQGECKAERPELEDECLNDRCERRVRIKLEPLEKNFVGTARKIAKLGLLLLQHITAGRE